MITPPDSREPTQDEQLGMTWFNRLTDRERSEWLCQAKSAVPADAWAAFKKGVQT